MRCPRCAGLIMVSPCEHVGDLEGRCLNCGHRIFQQVEDPINNLMYRWRAVMCETCHVNAAQRGREKCITCAARDRGRSHSQMIKDGLRKKLEAVEVVATAIVMPVQRYSGGEEKAS